MDRQAGKPTWGSRLRGIEGLRAIAAISVLVGHAWEHAQGSMVHLGALNTWIYPYLAQGLTLFFALSGFLLYRPFAAAIVRGERLPIVNAYLWNRGLRIMPGYLTILIIVGLIFGAANLTHGGLGYLWHEPGLLIASLGLVQNYYPGGVTAGIGPAWSLGAEIVFYLVLPVLALGAAVVGRGHESLGRTIAALLPAAAFALIGLLGNIWAASTTNSHAPAYPQAWGQNWHAVLERSFLVNADLFSTGVIAAVVVVTIESRQVRLPKYARALTGLAGVLVGGAAVLLARHGLDARVLKFVFDVACGLVILYVTLPSDERPGFPLRVLSHPVAFYLGTISYSIYLWHEPTIKWLHARGLMLSGKAGFAADVVITLALVVGLAAITYRFVESPANAKKRSMTPRGDSREILAADRQTLGAAP